MSGFLRRIRGARGTAPDPAPDEAAARSEGGGPAHATDAPTETGGPPALPAGVDLDALVGERPSTRRRGRLRRRLRHLRRVREVLLRDLGGVVLEVHRTGQGDDPLRRQVVTGKLARLDALTAELRELESVLDDRRPMVLREPGIGGSCPACGELFGSEARFCWACGTPVAPGAQRPLTRVDALPALQAAAAALPHEPAPAPAPSPAPHIEGSGEEVPHEEPAPAPAAPAEPAGAPVAPDPPATPGADQDQTRVLRPGDPLMERRP